MERVEIPLSKKKLILLMAAAFMFIIAGYWMYTAMTDNQTRYNPIFIKAVGISGIVVFGAALLLIIKKLFDNKPGLIIDETGITNNSSGASADFIPWTAITGMHTQQVKSTHFILIDLKDPEAYISRHKRYMAFMLKMNMKMYGTPVSIASTGLQCSFDELEGLLRSGLTKHKRMAYGHVYPTH